MLIDFAKEAPKPLLIIAHPAGGTGFLVECLRLEGLTVHHESPGPEGVKPDDTIVSFRYWPDRPCDWKPQTAVQLARDPFDHVFSMHAMSQRRPRFAREIINTFVPPELRSRLWKDRDKPPLKAVMASLIGFYTRCDGMDLFRVEDIPIPEGLERYNSHNRDGVGSYEELHEAHADFARLLDQIRQALGYTTEEAN